MFEVKGLQPVWDKTIVDENKTTAEFSVCTPIKKEEILCADKPWEKGMINYGHAFFDGKKYVLYYLCHYVMGDKQQIDEKSLKNTTISILDTYVCYAESKDGLNWTKPNLGLCEYEGSKDNNIILRSVDKQEQGGFFDNFCAFYDTNPNCPPEKKYKALVYRHWCLLETWASADGIRYTLENVLDMPGKFDSLNTCSYDERINKYVAYVRDYHDVPSNGYVNRGKRDVRRTESEDFVNWTTPELIKFNGSDDYPLYTNNISRYYRNKDIYIGFPTRYNERFAWSYNYTQLCGAEMRKEKMKEHPREGLTITDCIFMSSRDGLNWDKCDEALFRPGYEYEGNWVYGSCYPWYYMIETTTDDGYNTELSMFMPSKKIGLIDGEKKEISHVYRYTLRRDGFACYKANYNGAKLVTKRFKFTGEDLYINFSTSAKGYIFITIKDEEGRIAKTCELFGDSDNRLVHFEGVLVKEFSERTVTLEFEMRDAEIYAFEFK